MDELNLSGKTYISSKRAAKQYRYTTDYIGQLCRGGKLECQRVGRAWYVEEASLAAHSGIDAVTAASDTRRSEEHHAVQGEVPRETQTVQEAERSHTIHSIHALAHARRRMLAAEWPSITYLEDEDTPLIPFVSKGSNLKDERMSEQSEEAHEHTPQVVVFESRPDENEKKSIAQGVKKIQTSTEDTQLRRAPVRRVVSDIVLREPQQASHASVAVKNASRESTLPLIGIFSLLVLLYIGLFSFEARFSYSNNAFASVGASISVIEIYDSYSRYLVDLISR